MSTTLPPLAAIRVFEAAARHLSFTRAAAELGMTQAAVSYQIKLLEERVGAPLFLRRPREVTLTELGQRLAPEATRAFAILGEAFARTAERDGGTLIVNTMHTFAAQWLAPRLGTFQMRHPTIAVRLEIDNSLVDFAREEVDVVIRSGEGVWPGIVAHRLIDITYTPMLSPKLLQRIDGAITAAALSELPLIDTPDVWWDTWFETNGLPPERLARTREHASIIGTQSLTASAAMAGQGVALLVPGFFEQEVKAGRLVAPLDQVIDDGNAYWVAYSESRRNVPKIKAFRDWIVGEITTGT